MSVCVCVCVCVGVCMMCGGGADGRRKYLGQKNGGYKSTSNFQ